MATSVQPAKAPAEGERRPRKRFGKLRSTGRKLLISLIGGERYRVRRSAVRMNWGKTLLLVHTMGKVGSTSVAASLKIPAVRKTMTLFQPHFLSSEGIDFAEALAVRRAGSWDNLTVKGRAGFNRNRAMNKKLQELRASGKRVKVITMVRDPIATNLSGFFHNSRWWPAELKEMCKTVTADTLRAVGDYFFEHYTHDVPNDWFDMEVKTLYDVDVFSEPFDPQRGYAIYRSDVADVLLIKLEKLNECAADAMRDFLGLENFRLIESNKAESKEYAAVYQAFRKQVALPESYIDRMYNTKLARKFYSAEELDAFRRKWTAPKQAEVG